MDGEARELPRAERGVEIVFFDLGIIEILDDVDDARDALGMERRGVGEIAGHEHVAVVEDALFGAVEAIGETP